MLYSIMSDPITGPFLFTQVTSPQCSSEGKLHLLGQCKSMDYKMMIAPYFYDILRKSQDPASSLRIRRGGSIPLPLTSLDLSPDENFI